MKLISSYYSRRHNSRCTRKRPNLFFFLVSSTYPNLICIAVGYAKCNPNLLASPSILLAIPFVWFLSPLLPLHHVFHRTNPASITQRQNLNVISCRPPTPSYRRHYSSALNSRLPSFSFVFFFFLAPFRTSTG